MFVLFLLTTPVEGQETAAESTPATTHSEPAPPTTQTQNVTTSDTGTQAVAAVEARVDEQLATADQQIRNLDYLIALLTTLSNEASPTQVAMPAPLLDPPPVLMTPFIIPASTVEVLTVPPNLPPPPPLRAP
jgi:hypothetical protein